MTSLELRGAPRACDNLVTIEAVITGALAVGAAAAFIALPPHFIAEARLLEDAVNQALSKGYLGRGIFDTNKQLDVFVYKSLGGYIIGEETALMELMEGKVGRPRTKPPLPTSRGLFGMPTVVNNLETVLMLTTSSKSDRRGPGSWVNHMLQAP